jgi:hypothetical protein
MILDFCKKKEEIDFKKQVVFNCILGYYKELKETGVNVPYFIRARDWYNNNINSLKDLNYFYQKITERT